MKKLWLLLIIAVYACNGKQTPNRDNIQLQGEWQFALDTANIGIQDNWFLSELDDRVKLPGTTDENKKGFRNTDTTTLHLNRLYKYEGPAWYRKSFIIPKSFKDKHIQLILERTKSTKVWIDSTFVGESTLLESPQYFTLPESVKPGKHIITIRVDNNLKLTPYGNVHIYSDDTQTNWNGILGDIKLEASDKTYITNLQVYPDIVKKNVKVLIELENNLNLEQVDVELIIDKSFNGTTNRLPLQKTTVKCTEKIEVVYDLGNECSLWDDYNQPLYKLTAKISHGKIKDAQTVPFGMRKFSISNKQFQINGRTVFLRGKHEAAVFPLTGYPPMNVDEWRRVYQIAKTYGINHYRFHSYCPPEAAFTAADMEGIYLQAETPFWGGLDSDSVMIMQREEGYALLKAYANHPSFVMFSHGNEIWSGHDRVEQNILAYKKYDSRPLYTMGSNNGIGYVDPLACSDFFIGARTPFEKDSILTHLRLTQAFCDSKDGGILNTQTPSTEVDFSYAVTHMNIPAISHEIGQYQVYPDYSEITKYTGVLKAWNLEVFKKRLSKKGMADMDIAFHNASGAWSALCYKAEMEAALRTKGMAGFQLLDLQDFPGQGTALVGILDAFMDSKGVVTPEIWKQSCNDIVILARFPKYCYTQDEKYIAKLEVANYSNSAIGGIFKWSINTPDGNTLAEGIHKNLSVETGSVEQIGSIEFPLNDITNAEKLLLTIKLDGTSYSNTYPIWVYPSIRTNDIEKPEDIVVADQLIEEVVSALKDGGKVLLFPKSEDVEDKSLAGHFPPDFWNYGMFKGISEWLEKPVAPGTLGILTNPEHPIFNSFPTDSHTNWQWFSIVKDGRVLILDETPANYRPIVQVIDNLERNHKLGLIFEFKVGSGKLLVCMSPLPKLAEKPEAVQLYRSLLNYMQSDDFAPTTDISLDALKDYLEIN